MSKGNGTGGRSYIMSHTVYLSFLKLVPSTLKIPALELETKPEACGLGFIIRVWKNSFIQPGQKGSRCKAWA